ncbi:redoxin domain-containing protein [Ruania halotolerans]|uniref:redoxin domain-containing protein n=1 Tax=Ruania halotolerans TaxID=2897773 RepID=UPI001E4A5AD7|nr:redoxin domain-containing protein [Ruania halotolerans]UFU04893.1 redoxin domain-containing protein [Ruania halotolerans]
MSDTAQVIPAVGEVAPEFAARDMHGGTVTLAELRGAPVLLVFLPFAFTRVCGSEVAALRERHTELTADGTRVLVLTCDSMMTLRAWAEAEELPFDLLSDFWPHGQVARAYGAFAEGDGAPNRVSVLVGADGVVRWTTSSSRGVARDVDDYLTAIRALPCAA